MAPENLSLPVMVAIPVSVTQLGKWPVPRRCVVVCIKEKCIPKEVRFLLAMAAIPVVAKMGQRCVPKSLANRKLVVAEAWLLVHRDSSAINLHIVVQRIFPEHAKINHKPAPDTSTGSVVATINPIPMNVLPKQPEFR